MLRNEEWLRDIKIGRLKNHRHHHHGNDDHPGNTVKDDIDEEKEVNTETRKMQPDDNKNVG